MRNYWLRKKTFYDFVKCWLGHPVQTVELDDTQISVAIKIIRNQMEEANVEYNRNFFKEGVLYKSQLMLFHIRSMYKGGYKEDIKKAREQYDDWLYRLRTAE